VSPKRSEPIPSRQSLPAPPPSGRGRSVRAQIIQHRTANPPVPLRELGQLKLSVSNLISCF
jgi:hypothetical protein